MLSSPTREAVETDRDNQSCLATGTRLYFSACAATAAAAAATAAAFRQIEYEMRDRTDLLLPGVQAGLVSAVRTALGSHKPLVLVLMGGGVIDTAPVAELVDAVLWVGCESEASLFQYLSFVTTGFQ